MAKDHKAKRSHSDDDDDDEPELIFEEQPGPMRPQPPDEAVVILTLERATGRVSVDDGFSTKAETLHALHIGLSEYEAEYFPQLTWRDDG